MLAHIIFLVTGGLLFLSPGQCNPIDARSNAGCSFHLSVDAGGSPPAMYPVGQIGDGLCRARGDLEASTFTWFGDAFVDKQSRGCWWTSPTSVLQCDPSQQLSHGFDISCDGNVTFSGQSIFFACKTDDSANIYLEPNGAQCQPVTLVADGCQSSCYDSDSPRLSDDSSRVQGNIPKEASPDTNSSAADAQPSPLSPPAKDCPANIIWSPYEKPQLMIPVDRSNPAKAYGPTYLGQVSQNFSTVFNVDIPTSYAGKSCKVFFSFPTLDQLAGSNGTESYYFAGSGGVAFSRLEKPASLSTTWEDVFGGDDESGPLFSSNSSSGSLGGAQALGQTTIAPGFTYVVDRFACPRADAHICHDGAG
ncbi:ubiquitin 3 binding protein But2 C-terminal domain-containing protein [Apiospora phragmitis]|uniref:Ubiquitin 3 binding protein But2 C-terminal domain-containing protein n=1 Tax=Apiospora phragmitis TaxID=2905665 RepID=A0ABR1UV26_9PEZI